MIKIKINKKNWGQRGERQKIHCKNWESLCMTKNEGGMGFKELRKFNDAMLAKQVWQRVHDKESLLYRVFKAKLFPSGDIFSAQVKSGSYAWRSILKARYLLLKVLDIKWVMAKQSRFIKIAGYQVTSQAR